jgi:hypothetical protein
MKTMTLAIEWKEPPPSADPRDRLIAALKAEPGKWARIKVGMKSPTGHYVWKKLGFEAVSRPNDTDEALWDVYARFVPTQTNGTGAGKGRTNANGVVPPSDSGELAEPKPGTLAAGYLEQRRQRGIPAQGLAIEGRGRL